MCRVGINVKIKNAPKSSGIITARVKLEKDLSSCMRCKFFYGSNSQCLSRKCVEEESKPDIIEQDKEDICFACPYRQSEGYCFPCMKKLLERGGKTDCCNTGGEER